MISFDSITKEDLTHNYSLYNKMLNLMEMVDGKKPDGTCCGKGKEGAINKFIENREKYISVVNAIRDRKIEPKFSGALYFTKVGKRYYADRLTDAESLHLIENGYGYLFDTSKYNEAGPKKEEVKVEVEKKVEEPVLELLDFEEEVKPKSTPTQKKKGKKSAKRGKK